MTNAVTLDNQKSGLVIANDTGAIPASILDAVAIHNHENGFDNNRRPRTSIQLEPRVEQREVRVLH